MGNCAHVHQMHISFFALLLSAFSDGFDRFGVIEIENICHLLRNNISVIGVIWHQKNIFQMIWHEQSRRVVTPRRAAPRRGCGTGRVRDRAMARWSDRPADAARAGRGSEIIKIYLIIGKMTLEGCHRNTRSVILTPIKIIWKCGK